MVVGGLLIRGGRRGGGLLLRGTAGREGRREVTEREIPVPPRKIKVNRISTVFMRYFIPASPIPRVARGIMFATCLCARARAGAFYFRFLSLVGPFHCCRFLR